MSRKQFIPEVLALARNEVSVTESPIGSNWGTKVIPPHRGCVADYIRSAGYSEPVFWCMAFVFWVIREAAKARSITPIPFLRTGSCDLVLYWAREHGILHSTPEVGDVFLVMASANDAIHTGFVSSIETGGMIGTIEGNTSRNGSRNGIAVAARTRKAAGMKYVRFADLMKETATPDAPEAVQSRSLVTQPIKLIYGGKEIAKMPVVENVSLAPVRALLEAAGIPKADITPDPENPGVLVKGKLLPASITLREGVSYAPVRKLAAYLNLKIDYDATSRSVTLTAA